MILTMNVLLMLNVELDQPHNDYIIFSQQTNLPIIYIIGLV